MEARVLVAVEELPVYDTPAERIAHVERDVRDATGKVERKLRDVASSRTVLGWTPEDDTEYVLANRRIIGRLRITRGT